MADWSDADDDDEEFAALDVLEASAGLSIDDICAAVAKQLLFRRVFKPDMEPPHFGERFEVRTILGQGGYGAVFSAWDTVLQREVAIKLCAVDPMVDEAILLAEARALARLSHPNIIAVHECGQHADKLFMVMEFVAGGTLLEFVPYSWQEFVKVFADVARAVANAHKQGVIHGDIKPENILIDEDLRPRVADFGLARIIGAPTLMPDAIGTVPFASPELLAGQLRDQYSDQWAFIVALYERIEGNLPGIGTDEKIPSTEKRMLRALETWGGPPPMGDDVPPALVEIIKTGLAFKREDRFPDMDAVADALENVFISGLVPGPAMEEPGASEGVAVKPTEPSEDAGARTKAPMVKGVGIGVALCVFVGVLGLQIYVTKHRGEGRAESSEPQREPTPAERGEQKIQAALEIVQTVRNLTARELDVAEELWREGADLVRLSDKELAAKLTLELATQIQARKQGTAKAARLATQAAQWHEAEGQWDLAAKAQEQAIEVYKTAVDAPELGTAENCLASLMAHVKCESWAVVEP